MKLSLIAYFSVISFVTVSCRGDRNDARAPASPSLEQDCDARKGHMIDGKCQRNIHGTWLSQDARYIMQFSLDGEVSLTENHEDGRINEAVLFKDNSTDQSLDKIYLEVKSRAGHAHTRPHNIYELGSRWTCLVERKSVPADSLLLSCHIKYCDRDTNNYDECVDKRPASGALVLKLIRDK